MKVGIIVHPNSKKPRVEKDLFGALHLYVASPPQEGRANQEAIEIIAKYFNVSKSRVILISGQRSKLKTFDIG